MVDKDCKDCCWNKNCQFQNYEMIDFCTDEHKNSLVIKKKKE